VHFICIIIFKAPRHHGRNILITLISFDFLQKKKLKQKNNSMATCTPSLSSVMHTRNPILVVSLDQHTINEALTDSAGRGFWGWHSKEDHD
jgi:hypothetical protein